MEQQSAADTAATDTAAFTADGDAAAAASPSSILDGLSATDVNKMKVKGLASLSLDYIDLIMPLAG